MNDLNAIVIKLKEDYEKAISQGSVERIERLLTIFHELSDFTKEKIQELIRVDMQKIIDKLKNGLTIIPEDRDRIGLWIVGDAEQYAKGESRLEEWKTELKGIFQEINSLQNVDNNVASYFKFNALLKEASRILSAIVHFQQKKARVDKFEKAIQEMGPSERSILIRILEQEINSLDF